MEDTKKRTDFTIVQHHHTKLFLPADLVIRNHSHEGNSKEHIAAMENKPLQQRKNSNKVDDSQIGIDTEALKEIKKAGINPGITTVAHQQIALKQYEEEQKQKLTKPKKKNQEKIEKQKRIQEAKDELKLEDWSSLDVSLLDVEKQRKIFEEATHEKKIQKEKKLEEAIVQQLRLQDEEEKRVQEAAQQKRLQEEAARRQKEEATRQKRLQEETGRRQKEEAARQKRVQEEAARQKRVQEEAARRQKEEAARQQRLQEETAQRQMEEAARLKKVQEEAAQQERLVNALQNNKTCKTYTAANKNKYDDNDSPSEEFFDAHNTWAENIHQKGLPADTVHIPGNHDYIAQPSNDLYNPDHFGNQPQRKAVTPVITVQPHSIQDHKSVRSPDPQPSNENPHNLEIGSLIQFGNPPCYGVIKWIGLIPEANCTMAGVEVVSHAHAHVCVFSLLLAVKNMR